MKTIVFIPQIEHNERVIENAIIVNERVPIFVNFDRSLPSIGSAILSKYENGVIYADLLSDNNLKGLYPAIGGVYNDKNEIEIKEIGVCGNPNTDERIKAIE